MSSTNIIHSRLYCIEGVCYFDDDVISKESFDEAADHYYALVEALAEPWLTRDHDYDSLGRVNPSLTGDIYE